MKGSHRENAVPIAMKTKYDAKEKEVEEWKQRAHQLNEKLESKTRQIAKLQVCLADFKLTHFRKL